MLLLPRSAVGALSVYVDDLTLSGPCGRRARFWGILRKHVQLEGLSPLSNVLGRGHLLHDDGLALFSVDFARQCVRLHEELSNQTVKHYILPHMSMKAILLLLMKQTEGSYPMLLPSL